MLPVYWINKKESVKERQAMFKDCFEQKILNHLVEATQHNIPIVDRISSHIKAIHQAYFDGNEIALICEDNVDLTNFKRIFEKINEMILSIPEPFQKHWEVIQLRYTNTELLEDLNSKIDKVPNTLVKGYFNGCSAYLINREGMANLLRVMITPVEGDSYNYTPNFVINKHNATVDEMVYKFLHSYISLYPVVNTRNPEISGTKDESASTISEILAKLDESKDPKSYAFKEYKELPSSS